MYQELQDMEKKLDWTIMRKKAEVQDALGRTASVSINLISVWAMSNDYPTADNAHTSSFPVPYVLGTSMAVGDITIRYYRSAKF
jgi:hypothetical protein